jgi:hypothetical protein
MPRAVILTALPVEYLAVRAHLSELRETVYERGQFLAEGQSWDVGIVEVGQVILVRRLRRNGRSGISALM